MAKITLAQAPVFNKIIDERDLNNVDWQTWFNQMYDSADNANILPNDHLALNPDFNWSRTKGNTPTVGDGEFVEEWNVDAGGMTSTVTPTYYTSTSNNSDTGSERYVNFDISGVTVNEYQIYQNLPNKLNKFNGKEICFSALIMNTGSNSIKLKFHIGLDVNNNGTEDVITESKAIFVSPGAQSQFISGTFSCPSESTDNQDNAVFVKVVIFDASNPFAFNLYFIKPEFSKFTTPLYVDQTLEKLKIDNK